MSKQEHHPQNQMNVCVETKYWDYAHTSLLIQCTLFTILECEFHVRHGHNICQVTKQ